MNTDGRQTGYVDLEAGMGGTRCKGFGQAWCKVVQLLKNRERHTICLLVHYCLFRSLGELVIVSGIEDVLHFILLCHTSRPKLIIEYYAHCISP